MTLPPVPISAALHGENSAEEMAACDCDRYRVLWLVDWYGRSERWFGDHFQNCPAQLSPEHSTFGARRYGTQLYSCALLRDYA